VPLTTSPGEIITGLQSGLVDGAEFVGPGSDIALGLYRLASFYYAPGFNKPNGTGECIVSMKLWNSLDAQQKAILSHACAAEAAFALDEMERLNVEALNTLVERNGVKLRTFPSDMIEAARGHARDVIGEIGAKSEIAKRVVESYTTFRARTGSWADVSVKAILDSRRA
jgi:TRAP-type mannitol/chloroaromatic compound transport system substrate-binding protein